MLFPPDEKLVSIVRAKYGDRVRLTGSSVEVCFCNPPNKSPCERYVQLTWEWDPSDWGVTYFDHSRCEEPLYEVGVESDYGRREPRSRELDITLPAFPSTSDAIIETIERIVHDVEKHDPYFWGKRHDWRDARGIDWREHHRGRPEHWRGQRW